VLCSCQWAYCTSFERLTVPFFPCLSQGTYRALVKEEEGERIARGPANTTRTSAGQVKARHCKPTEQVKTSSCKVRSKSRQVSARPKQPSWTNLFSDTEQRTHPGTSNKVLLCRTSTHRAHQRICCCTRSKNRAPQAFCLLTKGHPPVLQTVCSCATGVPTRFLKQSALGQRGICLPSVPQCQVPAPYPAQEPTRQGTRHKGHPFCPCFLESCSS